LGAALPARIREALEPICPSSWWSWSMDETYIKVRGSWVYLYRAVDKAGQSVDFFLSRNHDVTAAKIFSPQCDKEPAHTHQDHTGRLCAVASRNTRVEGDRRTSRQSESAIEPILEQSHRAGASASETADSADARIQTIR